MDHDFRVERAKESNLREALVEIHNNMLKNQPRDIREELFGSASTQWKSSTVQFAPPTEKELATVHARILKPCVDRGGSLIVRVPTGIMPLAPNLGAPNKRSKWTSSRAFS